MIYFFKPKNNSIKNLTDIRIGEADFREPTLDHIKEEYARNFYWVNEKGFYEGIEILDNPDCVSFNEYQTELGQKKYWNSFLANLIKVHENKMLFKYSLHVMILPPQNTKCLVLTIHDDDLLIPLNDMEYETHQEYLTDITEEYTKKFEELVKLNEIEEFVKTHTADQVRDKYNSFKGNEEFFWTV